MTGLIQDLRLACRNLRRHPVWSATIVLVLALGIGGNMAMVSGFDAWVLRPLDFRDPERLVALYESQPALGRDEFGVAPKSLDDWRASARSLPAIEPYSRAMLTLEADEGDAERILGTRISAGLLPMLGKEPCLGRGFSAEEDLAGAPARVVLIGHATWHNRFAADPEILGRPVLVDGTPHEIVGVMEPGFQFPEWSELWVPMGLDPAAHGRERRFLNVAGRLADGATLADASAELAAIAAGVAAREPATNEGWSARATPIRDVWSPAVIRIALTASAGAALMVLLVICANVANLLLASWISRSRETALRAVLGATRWRLLRQAITESALLALLGGAIGGPLGILGTRLMIGLVPVDPPYLFAFRYDHRALIWTLVLSLLSAAAAVIGVVLRTTGPQLFDALRGGTRGGEGRRAVRLRGGLVGLEVAVSTALVIGALLMVKSFVQERSRDYGYERDAVLTAGVTLAERVYDTPEARAAFFRRAIDGLRQLPEVSLAGAVDQLPPSPGRWTSLHADGVAARRGEEVLATHHRVAGDYLEAIGVPIVAGRRFLPAELEEGAAVA
ncbi:MAG: ABC transporter permease, partial [Thermoanaerobaculia bacterium]|nr:ABC transporter permease [Thermoanaerobaculia bacterium]